MAVEQRTKDTVLPTVGPGVGILLGHRLTRRREVLGRGSCIGDKNIFRKTAVDGGRQTLNWDLTAIVKARHLTLRMDTGVGS